MRAATRAPDGAGAAAPVLVRTLAWLHIVLGATGLIAGGWFCIGVWLIGGWFRKLVLAFAEPVFIACLLLLFVPQLVGGIGLLRGRRWAKAMIGLLSAPLLLVFPLGTLLGGFGLCALFGGTVLALPRRRPADGQDLVGAADAAPRRIA